jgi:cation diffusion facilitator family transporter
MKWDDKVFAAGMSVLSNSILVVGKMIIGIVTGSITIISESLHSGVDLLASFIAYFSVRAVRKPADDEHPFGHGKIENVSGVIEALLILFAAVFIVHEAVNRLIHGGEIEKIGLGVLVMAIATTANMAVSWYLFKVARKTGSMALEADAEHLRTDVYTSLGVLVALGLIHFTGLTILDPIVAIIVAVYIGFIALRLTKKASHDLIDARLSEVEEGQIKEILDNTPEVLNYHCLRTRRSGNDRFIDAHIIVTGKMDVSDSHELADSIEKKIHEIMGGSQVIIHIEPCLGDCKDCEHPCPEEKKIEIAQHRAEVPGTREVINQIEQVLALKAEMIDVQDLHVHRFDGKWEVQLELLVPPDILVQEGHETAERVESLLRGERDDLGKITIHVEPSVELKDKAGIPDEEHLKAQVNGVLSTIRGIVGLDDIHVHRLEGKWEVHLDLVVPPDIPVKEGHETAEKVEEELRKSRPDLGKITIHVEPEGHVDK